MTMRRIRIACWSTKVTNTHLECVLLIALPLQHWLNERVSMLRYATLPVLLQYVTLCYITSLVTVLNVSLTVHHELTVQNYQRDALNIIYSSNIITLLYMFRVSSTHLLFSL